MPSSFLKKIAKDKGVSVEKLEVFWKEAKTAASEGGKTESDPLFFGLVTKIFKSKIKKHLGITTEAMFHFTQFLLIEKFIMEKIGGKNQGESPTDDSIQKVKDTDLPNILKKGVRNPPEFNASREPGGEPVTDVKSWAKTK